MYQSFYGLKRSPFELSPDPFFFYPTPHHNEALASLVYGVLRQKGFVVVTGEVGTGKTLLIRFLLETLSKNHVASAFVYNPRLSTLDFLSHVLADLHVPAGGGTKTEMLARLNNYLLARSRTGGITALVIDEAQLLSWDLLEEIRLLTNLETAQHKLLQIVLAGQPECDQKLDSPELRQLKQRIAYRCTLKPLQLNQLGGYINRRLELAGAHLNGEPIFPDDTIAAVHKFSNGIPRLVNTLCENVLVSGFARQTKQITPEMVAEVASTFRLDLPAPPPSVKEADPRKKVLRMMVEMLERMDGALDAGAADLEGSSGVRPE
jgi:general secretion pathway protein A